MRNCTRKFRHKIIEGVYFDMFKKIISTAAAAAVVISCVSCGKNDENGAEQEASGHNVTVYTAQVSDIKKEITYSGEIVPCESVGVSSKVSAKAERVYYQEGDYVQAGAVLATLDDTDVRLSYQQAQASYNSAQANYSMVKNSSVKQSQQGANQSLSSAELSYQAALDAYNREKQLYDENSNVKLAKQAVDDAQAAYDRQKQLYDSDASVIAAQNALTTAQQNSDRTQQLFDIGAVSQAELDNAKTSLQNAQASYDSAAATAKAQLDSASSALIQAQENYKTAQISASASLTNAENSLKQAENALKNARENVELTEVSGEESIKSAAASVQTAKAGLDSAKNMLDSTTIKAPISGYISARNVTEGQMTAAGVDLFVIKNSNVVDAEIYVTESVIASVSVGTPARVSVASAGIENVEGAVTLVNTVKNEQTGLYTVEVSIDNAGGLLKLGMFADITLVTEESSDSVVIPSDAVLLGDGDEKYVYVAKDGIAQRRDITVGITNSDTTEILAGVETGEDVVVSGKEYISETDNKVNITSKEEISE